MISWIRNNPRYLIVTGIIAVVTWFTTYLVYGKHGFLQMRKLEEKLILAQELNNGINQENKQIQQDIYLLKNSPKYIEHFIRSKTSFVKENEIIYHFR